MGIAKNDLADCWDDPCTCGRCIDWHIADSSSSPSPDSSDRSGHSAVSAATAANSSESSSLSTPLFEKPKAGAKAIPIVNPAASKSSIRSANPTITKDAGPVTAPLSHAKPMSPAEKGKGNARPDAIPIVEPIESKADTGTSQPLEALKAATNRRKDSGAEHRAEAKVPAKTVNSQAAPVMAKGHKRARTHAIPVVNPDDVQASASKTQSSQASGDWTWRADPAVSMSNAASDILWATAAPHPAAYMALPHSTPFFQAPSSFASPFPAPLEPFMHPDFPTQLPESSSQPQTNATWKPPFSDADIRRLADIDRIARGNLALSHGIDVVMRQLQVTGASELELSTLSSADQTNAKYAWKKVKDCGFKLLLERAVRNGWRYE